MTVKVQGGQFTKDPYKKFKLSSPFVTLGFNGQKYEKSKWKNGLIDTESVPYETTNWVTTHPKVRAMMSASLGEARVQELPQLGKSNKKSSSKKK